MQPTTSIYEFKYELNAYLADKVTFLEFDVKMQTLARDRIGDLLSGEQEEAWRDIMFWLDVYDPDRPPRKGIVGRILNGFDAVFGEQRVSKEHFMKTVQRLRDTLDE